MNNAQTFIASEFDYIADNVPESSKQFKPSIMVSHGLATTKHISINWEQFEYIKQYLIDSEKGERKMINSDKIAYQVFDAIDNDLFLPINKKISLEYLNSDMDGIFENERSWRSFINGNFSCEYDKNSWRDDCKPSTIKKWTYTKEEYIDLFVVKVGKDSYTKVSPEDINLEFSYSLYYNNSSSFPVAVEIFVIATIKG